jgi:hypothetical protein
MSFVEWRSITLPSNGSKLLKVIVQSSKANGRSPELNLMTTTTKDVAEEMSSDRPLKIKGAVWNENEDIPITIFWSLDDNGLQQFHPDDSIIVGR